MKKALLAAGALLLGAALVGSRWEDWLVAALAPGVPFDPRAVPAAPDYAEPSAWTARPDRHDAADAAPAGLRPVERARERVDAYLRAHG